MYFKINKTGCQEHKGLCEIRYDLYLDQHDERHSAHYVTVPVFPEGGYPGELDERDLPADLDAYKAWYDSLPRVTQNNPFCCHFCQFEPNVTDEEILFVGELALDMAMKNWISGDLHKNKNLPVQFSTDATKRAVSKNRSDLISGTDFAGFSKSLKNTYSIRD